MERLLGQRVQAMLRVSVLLTHSRNRGRDLHVVTQTWNPSPGQSWEELVLTGKGPGMLVARLKAPQPRRVAAAQPPGRTNRFPVFLSLRTQRDAGRAALRSTWGNALILPKRKRGCRGIRRKGANQAMKRNRTRPSFLTLQPYTVLGVWLRPLLTAGS